MTASFQIIRGAPTETEVAALVAGLVSYAAAQPDVDDEARSKDRWQDPARVLKLGPIGRAGARGADAWRWSLR